jgi:hypothetical protein
MVGLTRFFILMNLCEKSGVSPNIYRGIALYKKDAEFRRVKKLSVLQGIPNGLEHSLDPKLCSRNAGLRPRRVQSGG